MIRKDDNHKKQMNRRHRLILKRIISLVIVVAMVLNIAPMEEFVWGSKMVGKYIENVVHAATTHTFSGDEVAEIEINSLTDLETLSANYQASPANYQYTTIKFNQVITDEITETSFTPLGIASKPFKGQIVITQVSGSSYSIISEVPLFDYISDSVEIKNSNGENVTISFHRTIDSNNYAPGLPLFANHVVHDTDEGATAETSWNFSVNPYTDTENDDAIRCYNFAGIFGEIDKNADVTVAFANDAIDGTLNANIYNQNAGDVGLIAGKMAENSTVNASLTGSNTSYTVEASSNGNAGRFVGSMLTGSTLNIITDVEGYITNDGGVTANKFAGGLVGSCDKATVTLRRHDPGDSAALVDWNYAAKGTVTGGTGNNGAGGIYGYYETNSKVSFDLTKMTADGVTVTGGNCGGLFGMLKSGADFTISNGTIKATGGTVTKFGGIAGNYSTTVLENTMLIGGSTVGTDSVSVELSVNEFSGTAYYGGAIGFIGGSASYVKAENFTCKSTGGHAGASYFGGVIGTTENTESMIDVGTFTLETKSGNNVSAYKGGGVVGKLNKGVLCLTGTTDFTQAKSDTGSSSKGQIVGTRGCALIYAVGDGSSTSTNWKYNRYIDADVHADDIGTWGEVVRVSSDSVIAADTLYFNDTEHTVTIAAAETTMDSDDDLVRTALNIQLNDGSNTAGSSLRFAGSQTSSALLSTALTISGSRSFAGTGITGFTRDDGVNAVFTSSLTGTDSASISLANGEYYGANISDSALGKGHGEIYAHKYNGLFAKTGAGVSFSDFSIVGTSNVCTTDTNFIVGALAAEVGDGGAVTNIDTGETLNVSFLNGNTNQNVGGVFGSVSGNNTANLTFSETGTNTIHPIINISGTHHDTNQCIGGVIGRVWSVKEFEIDLTGLTVSPTINSTVSGADVKIGGVIAAIEENSSSDTRTVNLNNVTITNTSITSSATSRIGGLLGYSWDNTNVTTPSNDTTGLTVTGTNAITASGAGYSCGLLSRATGHWTVYSNGIIINGLTCSTGTTGFGMIALDGYAGDITSGLFLEMMATDSYQLGEGMTIPNATTYDEFIAYSNKTTALSNSSAIVSIRTDGDYSMDKTTHNGYVNKYNTGKLNYRTRYYYNVSEHRTDTSAGSGWALLNWSLYRYAAPNLKQYFPSDIKLSGTYDMDHISYYPIDIDTETISNNITIKFYSSEINTTEGKGADKRTNAVAGQHLLMHGGLFRNVTGTLSVTNITLQGNTAYYKNGNTELYTGAIVCGTVSGNITLSKVVLDGLKAGDTNEGYLIVNRIESATNTKKIIKINNVSAANYANNSTAASSLMGDVKGTYIELEFSGIKLDSRSTNNGSPATLKDAYGTTKSIFKNATLLNRLDVDANSTAIYNYTFDEDWGIADGETSSRRNVTYGKEISESVENAGGQNRYYGSTRHHTHPDSEPNASSTAYSFASGFLPYVRNYAETSGNSNTYTTHELKVNVFLTGFTDGCGTYNHPYEITKANQLVELAKVLNTDKSVTVGTKFRLPKTYSLTDHWCDGENSDCYVFTYNGTNFKNDAINKTWTVDQVRLYLASAYYQIQNDITIEASDKFLGLGSSTSTNGNYAFRGVIVGKKQTNGEYPTITNKTARKQVVGSNHNTMGLISISNGSVIKDLNISVVLPETDKYNYMAKDNKAYAYNEEFPNYGAVINKIMGGDIIIDNVTVSFNVPFKVQYESSHHATVGGYVGCVVNGALIFRNINDSSLKTYDSNTAANITGFIVNKVNNNGVVQTVTIGEDNYTNLTNGGDMAHMFVNPFVGRVINGYAVREDSKFTNSEDGATYSDGRTRSGVSEVTIHNTRKNYSIPDINPGAVNKLTFSQKTEGGAYNVVTVPDAQSLYIMSIITQSGAGCASSEKASDGGSNNTDNYTYNISYCGNDGRSYSGGVNDNYKATHLASYSEVGSSATSSGDYAIAVKDTINSRKAVPYIIYKYTSSYNDGATDLYPARCLTMHTFYMVLAKKTTYYLPDCFRGLGFIGDYTNDKDNGAGTRQLQMRLYGLDGGNSRIDMNTQTSFYVSDNANSDDPYNTNNTWMWVGLALFNRLTMRNAKDSTDDLTFNADADYQVHDFDITGYVSGTNYLNTGLPFITSKSVTEDDYQSRKKRCYTAAGLVGMEGTKANNDNKNRFEVFYNVVNVDVKDFHVESSGNAGAYIACLEKGKLYFNNCDLTNVTVEGSGRVGGFIGCADGQNNYSGMHVNANIDGASTTMKNISIRYRNITRRKSMGFAGGLVGSYWGENIESNVDSYGNRASFIFNNISITSDDEYVGYTSDETNYFGNFIGCTTGNAGYAGGIIGNDEKSQGCVIVDCTIEKTNIQADCVGGILGGVKITTNDKCIYRISNCQLVGDLDDDNKPKYFISGYRFAGGVVGYDRDNASDINIKFHNTAFDYKINGCLIKDYEIKNVGDDPKKNDANDNATDGHYGVGGLLGYTTVTSDIVNSKVESCLITSATTQTNHGLGGIVGFTSINNGFQGFNIEVCNSLIKNTAVDTDTKIGNLIGFATDDTGKVKIAGYSRKGNTSVNDAIVPYDVGRSSSSVTAALPSGYTNDTNKSYIIFSDYTGASFNKSWSFDEADNALVSGIMKSGVSNVTSMGAAPYATVLPFTNMGSYSVTENEVTTDLTEVLTGDGAVLRTIPDGETATVAGQFIAKSIVDDDTAEGYGICTDKDKVTVSNLISADDNATIRLTTYETEMGVGSAPNGHDFPVISMSGSADFKAELNAYINVLTNTDDKYFDSNSGNTTSQETTNFGFDILKCQFIDRRYQVVDGEGSLEYRPAVKEIRMRDAYADTNQENNQITVLDLKFYDPVYVSDKKVAYHLYIPILTKKMIKFDFSSTALSGTDYVAANYPPHFGKPMAENFDNWFTMYVRYTYDKSQLQTIVDSGIGLYWNNDKSVQLKYTMEQGIADDSQFVLIDPNGNKDRAYYATKDGTGVSSTLVNSKRVDTLLFNRFKESDGASSFTPINLNDLVLVTYSNSNEIDVSKRVYVETTENDSDVCAYAYEDVSKANIKYFKRATDGTGNYALTVESDQAVEDYYISVFTYSESQPGGAYEMSIEAPGSLSGLYMSKRDKQKYSTVLLGDLFKQTVSINPQSLNEQVEITKSNNYVSADVTSTITFIDSANVKYVRGKFINGNFTLYQGFVLRLNRIDAEAKLVADQQIHGVPGCEVTNTVNNNTSDPNLFTLADGASYILSQPVALNVSDSDDWSSTVTASYNIQYAANEDVLETEFPPRQAGDTHSGIYISASSNLAYNNPDSVTYSTKRETVSREDKVYYMSKEQKAKLQLNAKSEHDIYDKYGDASNNMSLLGINAKYLEDGTTEETILGEVIFDVSDYANIDSADNVKFSLSLGQKAVNGTTVSYTPVDLNTYIKDIKFLNADGDEIGEFTADNNNTLVFKKNSSGNWEATYGSQPVEIDYDKAERIFTADIIFTVYTGSALERIRGYKYSNYRLWMDAELNSVVEGEDTPFATNSHDSDYLIYSNVKVNAEFVQKETE